MIWILISVILFSGCASALWARNEDGKMELKKVYISTGPAQTEDAENKGIFPDLLLPRP